MIFWLLCKNPLLFQNHESDNKDYHNLGDLLKRDYRSNVLIIKYTMTSKPIYSNHLRDIYAEILRVTWLISDEEFAKKESQVTLRPKYHTLPKAFHSICIVHRYQ